MTREQVESFIHQKVAEIMEVADTCQIFITQKNVSDDTTESFTTGAGNFYAREGQVKTWITMQDEYAKCQARSNYKKDNPTQD